MHAMKDLTGKVALVTGGSRGIGKAIVRDLAARGADIVLNYFHSHDQAKQTRDELVAEGARVDLVRASVARQEQVDRMFQEIDRLHGRLDILVNNAANGALLPPDEVTDADLDKAIETNYKGGLRCSRAAAPLMARGGGGSIVTVSALGGSQMVMANYSACAPAKAAAEAASRYLAVELAPSGIRVNTASAAMLSSEVADKFPQAGDMQDVIARATPWGRLGRPEEFAALVSFLASDDARWITGQVILADGGLTLGAALLSPPAEGGEATPEVQPARHDQHDQHDQHEPAEFGDDAIAVVGMGMAVAGANSPDEFWKLRTTGDELFVKVPRERWQHDSFHSFDLAAEDKAYAEQCVFITDFAAAEGALEGMPGGPGEEELTTMWLRHSLVQALDGVRHRDTDRCSFVVGYTPDGSQHLEEAGVLESVTRLTHGIVDGLQVPDERRDTLREGIDRTLSGRYRRGVRSPSRFLPHRVGEVAMDGVLPPSTELHMVDTACSSSLYAIDIAAKGLLMGKQDIAVCGGAFALAPRGTVLFSKLQGLSKRGTVQALDESADGVIFADGAALVVLKRLRTARQDGDQVLGVLRAFGSSSDGKGKAIYAPNAQGQGLAVQRALEGGEVDSADVQWINAHATGTPAGDLEEFTTLREHFGTSAPTAVTSNKSLLGHTGWAAGVVSLIESLKGLEHDTIPGQFRLDTPRADFRLADTGLEVTSEPRDWPASGERPRLAAVSGFGFGGTNAHLIVSESRTPAEASVAATATTKAPTTKAPATDSRVALVGWSAHVPGLDGREDVTSWLAGGRQPRKSFGTDYPVPPFNKVRLPPKTIRALDRCQLMVLECAHQLRDQMPHFWSEQAPKTGVFVGHMGPTRAAMLYANRCYLDDVGEALAASPAAGAAELPRVLDRLREQVRSMIPESNEDSFPGQMPNIIAARVANYFDLNGSNMTLDSGFASALSSITLASRYLRTGELDFALAGGINGNSLPEYRSLIGDLLPEREKELAEGAFLFALTTEERALRADLPVLAYVDETLDGTTEPEPETVLCGANAPENARYLGAAGGLAVLRALHGPAGRATVTGAGNSNAAGAGLRLTIPGVMDDASVRNGPEQSGRAGGAGSAGSTGAAGSAGSAGSTGGAKAAEATGTLRESFRSTDHTEAGEPLRVRRRTPVLEAAPAHPVREPAPFLPDGAVVVTDAPALLARVAGPDSTLTVLSTTPFDVSRPGWHHLPRVTPETVREVLSGVGRPLTQLRVLSDLSRAMPPDQAYVPGTTSSLLTLNDAAYLAVQCAYDDLALPGSALTMLLLGAVSDGTPHPFSGLFTGLLKSAGLELSAGGSLAFLTSGGDVEAAVRSVEEESRADRNFPVVAEIGGVRSTWRLRDEPVTLDEATPAALDRDSVVVVAGGTRGITAEVVKSLAREFGSHIHVLGSNALDAYPPSVFAGTDEEFAAGRAAYISAELAKREGRNVASITKEFDRMLNARESRRNLRQMAAHSGAERVTYRTCDMRDGAEVEKALGQVLREQGRIDLLINAAGLQRSALIRDKDFAEFTSIRDLKVQSYLNLKHALRDAPPRLWCNFGSLLGYFGQLGEADYAAANDFLGSASTHAAATSDHSEVTIGWTLWSSVGMGAGELTTAYYERAGSYSSMPVPEGVHHFVQELHAPVRRPSVVHLGDAEEATVEKFYPGYLTRDTAGSRAGRTDRAEGPDGFFLRRVVYSDGRSAEFECPFDLRTDAYLDHHTVRGEPTLPGTFVTELAAEAARHLVPGRHVVAFEDLRFEHFLRVYRDVPAPKRIKAEIVEDEGDLTVVQVQVCEDVVAPSGVVLVKDRLHFAARVLLADTFADAPRWDPWDSADDTPVPDPYHQPGSPVRLSGPFVSTTGTGIHPRGKRGRYDLSLPSGDPVWQRFTVPCVLLDGLARVGVLDLVDGRLVPVAAPLSIRRIDLYEEANDHTLSTGGSRIDLYATPPGFGLSADRVENRFVAARPDGRMVLQMKDLRAALIGYVDARTGEAVPAGDRAVLAQGA
ncbi:SDR family oxidoreductase [Streptomyces sp. S.PB5]|uniref:SDR family oxidoreductase n=1 Tax=Streptomyces sp. S.PB5 TaxID=3020844 RepID=UPI0025B1F76D|nr:SDR family oxidoreductase [Streptomyces sp. S.PB5]MDN3028373.1 SDR family oxidoreductase [Streptomyces sp. S.PB5]